MNSLLIDQVYKDRNVVAQLVRRAERAGFKAIALTVDTPRLGRREADIKNRSSINLRIQFELIKTITETRRLISFFCFQTRYPK